MRKEYISPSLTVVVLATEGLLATSVPIDSTSPGGGEMDTRKKEQTTEMWGNPQSKGIWD